MLKVELLNSSNNAMLGDSPAALSRQDGIIYINMPLFSRYNDFQKRFIILHELGHYYLNTNSEIKADAYAFSALAGTEKRSLRQSIETIEATLKDGNQTKAERLRYITLMAYKWDADNGNQKAALEFCRLQDMLGWSFSLFGFEIMKGNDAGEEKALAEADYIKGQTEELRDKTRIYSNTVESFQRDRKVNNILEYVVIILGIVGIIWLAKE